MINKLVPEHYFQDSWYERMSQVQTSVPKDIKCFGKMFVLQPYEDEQSFLHEAMLEFVGLHSNTIFAWRHSLISGGIEHEDVLYTNLDVLGQFPEGSVASEGSASSRVPYGVGTPHTHFQIVELCKPMYFELARLGADRRFMFIHYFRVEKK